MIELKVQAQAAGYPCWATLAAQAITGFSISISLKSQWLLVSC